MDIQGLFSNWSVLLILQSVLINLNFDLFKVVSNESSKFSSGQMRGIVLFLFQIL